MHTMQVVGGGFLLLAAFVFGARFVGLPMTSAALAFIPVWFLAAGINLWIGISRAGYSFGEEAPIFLVVFGVPAMAAAYLWWTYSAR